MIPIALVSPFQPLVSARVPKYLTGYPLQGVQIFLIEPLSADLYKRKVLNSDTVLLFGCGFDPSKGKSSSVWPCVSH